MTEKRIDRIRGWYETEQYYRDLWVFVKDTGQEIFNYNDSGRDFVIFDTI